MIHAFSRGAFACAFLLIAGVAMAHDLHVTKPACRMTYEQVRDIGRPPQPVYAASVPWRESVPARLASAIVAEADRHLGQGNFTGRPGPWCAWFVSAVLRATGHRELPSGMAASALAYGPRTNQPRPGDLAVIATRRGRLGHVGIVVADFGAEVEIVSGNWGRRVARARVPRRSVAAFVRV